MHAARRRAITFFGFLLLPFAWRLAAANLDLLGVTLLRQVEPGLLGGGLAAGQVEAADSTNSPPTFEVNPATVGQPGNKFIYTSSLGSETNFPNSVGGESGHANGVAANIYGPGVGVSPGIDRVENYHADYFLEALALPVPPTSPAPVLNQSFIVANADGSHVPRAEELAVETAYDNYAAEHNTLFVSGAGNSGPIYPPATCYNGIGVAVVDGSSSYGPTPDGRSKPDLTAPGSNNGANGATSFSTPYVTGAAVVLLQAALRGDGGTDSSLATNSVVLKALLLNGAVKPAGWTNGPTAPLDGRHGAGIVNLFNSWNQLTGGRQSFIESTTVSNDAPHPPGGNTTNVSAQVGWDFNSVSTLPTQDQLNHYYFEVPADDGKPVTFTATLAWLRHANQTTVSDMNLFLYDAIATNLVAASVSTVDNIEHLYVPALSPGRYDLQVLKRGSLSLVSQDETYALAFEFFSMPLQLRLSNGNVILRWPFAPTGFRLLSATNLMSPANWTDVSAAPVLSDGFNVVTLPATTEPQYFRLQRP